MAKKINRERVILGIDPGTTIMGYGIIAVPTGIVTAEFASMKNRNQNNKKCHSCTSLIFNPEARYCHHCGEKLENE